MKKLLLSIAMLFSITIYSQELSDKLRGTWSSSDTTYYVVILHDKETGYEFVNFSFAENRTVKETVVEATDTYVKTKILVPENNWEVFITYTIKDDKLYCEFNGSSNSTTLYTRYYLMTNKI